MLLKHFVWVHSPVTEYNYLTVMLYILCLFFVNDPATLAVKTGWNNLFVVLLDKGYNALTCIHK